MNELPARGNSGERQVPAVSKLLILKTGSTIPTVLSRRRDFEVWITTGTGWRQSDVVTVSAHLGEHPGLPTSYAGIVVTGSQSMVTERAPWSVAVEAYLRDVLESGVPVLGICYGHQLLCQALGGRVADNPLGRNIGTVDVTLTEDAEGDPLFSDFGFQMHVPVSHMQSVIELPGGSRRLGRTRLDPNHAARYGEHAWGVQFHPEFDASIVREYIDARRPQIEAEGLDAEALKDGAVDTADGTILLRRFASYARHQLS